MNKKYKFRGTAPDFQRIVDENPGANAVLVVSGPRECESVLLVRFDVPGVQAAADRAGVNCSVAMGLPGEPVPSFTAEGRPMWWMNIHADGPPVSGWCYCCHAVPAELRRVAQALAEEPHRAASVEVLG
jgi:hypothetical protein